MKKKVISGRDVAKSVFSDVESFFYPSAGFYVARRFDYSSRHHASIVGGNGEEKIALSEDFCNYVVSDIDDMFFICIILCHECAHYLNRHNNHFDVEDIETTAIETWADYFGARLLATLISVDGKVSDVYRILEGEKKQEVIVPSLGRALGRVYETIYSQNVDSRYPDSIERVATFNAGFTSFFYRLYGELKPNFIAWVLLTIIKEAGLKEELADFELKIDKVSSISETVGDVHKKIQGESSSISGGVKPQYRSFLETNYNISDEQKDAAKERMVEEARKVISGFSL